MRHSARWSRSLALSLLVALAVSPLRHASAAEPRVLDRSYKLVRLVKDTLFPGCNGATIGADGALYVVHTGNGSTTRIDLETMKATPFVPPYAGTFITDDITSDDKGNLYSTGTTPIVGEVYRIDRNGKRTVIARGLTAPNGIQYDRRTGRLFTSECFQANRIFELDPTGAREPRLLVKENVIPVPEGFGFDPDTGDLLVPDMGTGKILRVNPDSGAVATIADQFAAPMALKVGPDKMAYFPQLNGAVFRLSLDGRKREKLAQLPPGLDNLAITPEGRLFVTSYWDATVYEVATDGSGKFRALFPTGPNSIDGVLFKNGKLLVSDAIMIRTVEKGRYLPTKLNAWAAHHMPLPIGIADGPGDQVLWPDAVNNAVGLGNPATGEFKAIAGDLKRPVAVLMGPDASRVYVAEYGAGQITEVSLADGAKRVLAAGLEGPVSMTIVDGALYVGETKAGRISKVDPRSGAKEVFVAGVVGKPGALAHDGAGNVLALDLASGRLFRIDTRVPKIAVVAEGLPVAYVVVGGYPPVEFAGAMAVSPKGDIYVPTSSQGLLVLQRGK